MLKKFLTKVCVASLALGGVVAGVAVTATPASADTGQTTVSSSKATERAAAPNRLSGPWVMTNNTADTPQWWVQTDLSFGRGDNPKDAIAKAAQVSIPAVNETGPVVVGGKCVTQGEEFETSGPSIEDGGWEVFLDACDGRAEQQFKTIQWGYVELVSAPDRFLQIAKARIAIYKEPSKLHNERFLVEGMQTEFTAQVDSVDQKAKTADISGRGVAGAKITISGPAGELNTLVAADGTWKETVPGLKVGNNKIPVTQTIASQAPSAPIVLNAKIDYAPLTSKVESVDNPGKSAVLVGTGAPEAKITITTDGGKFYTDVATDGTWSLEITGLVVGKNDVSVTQTFDSETSQPQKHVIEITAAPLTASITGLDNSARIADVGGTGEPGALITVTGPSGDIETKVATDGTWSAQVPGLKIGKNPILVTQTVNGDRSKPIELIATISAQGPSAWVESVDNPGKSAVVVGTGEPGGHITVTGPNSSVDTQVDAQGNWKVTVPKLNIGDNPLHVTQTVEGKPAGEADVTATITAAPLTADARDIDHEAKTAQLFGTAEPGATVTVKSPTQGNITTVADPSGNWVTNVNNLAVGITTFPVTQTIAGVESGPVYVSVQINDTERPLTAHVDEVFHEEREARISGTGQPGATVTATTPTGPVEFTVDSMGHWSGMIGGLAVGKNIVPVTQTVKGVTSAPIPLTIIIEKLEIPLVDPMMAGGFGLLLAAAGAVTLVRRRSAAVVTAD